MREINYVMKVDHIVVKQKMDFLAIPYFDGDKPPNFQLW